MGTCYRHGWIELKSKITIGSHQIYNSTHYCRFDALVVELFTKHEFGLFDFSMSAAMVFNNNRNVKNTCRMVITQVLDENRSLFFI